MDGRKEEARVWFHYVMIYYDDRMNENNGRRERVHSLHNFDHIQDWYIADVKQLRDHVLSASSSDRKVEEDIRRWDVDSGTPSKVSK